ncbi:MAG TPA: XdhC family protein [Acidimicrobiales bacterium]|nr:XdhC family protein [Acidimicrobiales bacterium]
MYGVALSVQACLRAGTRVHVAWVVESQGFSARDRTDALAITPGGGRVGTLLSGSVDGQLADLASRGSGHGRVVDVDVSDVDALVAGLSCGGQARCLLVPANTLPSDLWELLLARQPVCLVTGLDGDEVVDTSLFTTDTIAGAGEDVARLFGRGASDATVADDSVVTALWPVSKLVIVGAGAIADALAQAASLLGWQAQTINDVDTATGVIAGLAVLDKLVVISHDHEFAGRALAAALSSEVGYIGALGSRRTQQGRADWLAYRGITDLERIHGPAGLDIGANTPAEIAVSIVAEAMAVKSGASAASLRAQTGSIH